MSESKFTKIILSDEFVKPAQDYKTHKRNEPVKLQMGIDGLAATKPITLLKFFRENCEKYAAEPALSYMARNETGSATNWITLTYADYVAKVEHVALMLLKLGLEPFAGVGIWAHNCPEWFYTNFGAIQAGGNAFGIYQTSSMDAVHHMLKLGQATICIVDDAIQMAKVRSIHSRLPKLRAVIQLNWPFDEFVDNGNFYYKWADLFERNVTAEFDESLHAELKRRESEIYANQCAALVFTHLTERPKAYLGSKSLML